MGKAPRPGARGEEPHSAEAPVRVRLRARARARHDRGRGPPRGPRGRPGDHVDHDQDRRVAAAYASVARGADAYFKYVNARGGVNGRKIEYTYLDDAYNQANTIQQTRKLVQEDKVFAIYNSLGTE